MIMIVIIVLLYEKVQGEGLELGIFIFNTLEGDWCVYCIDIVIIEMLTSNNSGL